MRNALLVGMCAAALMGAGVVTPCLGDERSGVDQPAAPTGGGGEAPPHSPDAVASQQAGPRQAEYIHIIQDTVKEGAYDDYERLQMARAKVLAAAHWPKVSIGLKPITGPSLEVLRISFFNSFEELGEAEATLDHNPTLTAKLKELDRKEAHLLQGRIEVDARYRPAISYHGEFNWADMRYVSIIKIHLIPGHGAEYTQNRDIVIKAHNDAALQENLAVYTVNSGTLSSSYRIVRPITSLKGFDAMDAMHGARYEGFLGKENQKKLVSLFAQSVQTEEEEYYKVDKKLSYLTRDFLGTNSF